MSDEWEHRLSSLGRIPPTPGLIDRATRDFGPPFSDLPRRRGGRLARYALILVVLCLSVGWAVTRSTSSSVRSLGATVQISSSSPVGAATPLKPFSVRGSARQNTEFGAQGNLPFLGAEEVTLQRAEGIAGFSIPRPNDSIGSDDRIDHVWVAQDLGELQIEIDYTSGLYVELGPANPGMADPVYAEGVYREVAAQDDSQLGGLEQVTSVNGIPAYLVPDGAARWANGESQGAPGTVSFVLGGENVDVVGHFSNEELLRVAASVTARPST